MSIKYKTGNDQLPHFITFSVIQWIDVFTKNQYKDLFVDSLNYCIKEKGLCLNAWVIMTNHIHLIMKARENFVISNILRDLKKFTSKQIIKSIIDNPQESRKEWLLYMFEREGNRNSNNQQYQFWQQDNHPIELSNDLMLQQKLDYLHQNPVKAGFVCNAEEYIYSSAMDYCTNKKGMVQIEHLYV